MKHWGMYDADGDAAISAVVDQMGPNARGTALAGARVEAVQRVVSKNHPEVHDTVVREVLYHFFVTGENLYDDSDWHGETN